jgi:hypothetical protein
MAYNFRKDEKNWVEYRHLPKLTELDFHDWYKDPYQQYWEFLQVMEKAVWDAIKNAQENGNEWLLVTHGSSTSRPGKTTARSITRKVMNNKKATPFIVRKQCIQQETVFLAKIRGK